MQRHALWLLCCLLALTHCLSHPDDDDKGPIPIDPDLVMHESPSSPHEAGVKNEEDMHAAEYPAPKKLLGFAVTVSKDGPFVDGAAVLAWSILLAHMHSE